MEQVLETIQSTSQYIIQNLTMTHIRIIYLVIINIVGYYSMKQDKKKAVKKKYRIPEKRLFAIALLGGSLGSTISMFKYRHKTKHWYFKFGFPFILICQILLISGVLFTEY